MASKALFTTSREGFYIDTLWQWGRSTILSPTISFAIFALLKASRYVLSAACERTVASVDLAARIFQYLTILAAGLSLNGALSTAYLNDWTDDPTWNWDQEVVVITGGSSGIGASLAKHLISTNTKTTIVIVDYGPLTFQPSTTSKFFYYRCDLSDPTALKNTCARIKVEVGNPTVLVNNAGMTRGAMVMDGTYHDVDITFRTNIIAPFLLAKEFLPHMVEKNHGHIIGVSSMSAIVSPAGLADYAATKAGVLTLSEASFGHKPSLLSQHQTG